MCGDTAQASWFLRWTPFALFHGLNPWFTNFIDFPSGVNMAENPTMPLLGLLTAPISKIFGPVSSFNFLLWLGFTSSATSAFFVLRHWVDRTGAAFVGGLLYGFSPYMIVQGEGHAIFLFVPIPPLVLYVLDELVVRQRSSPRKWGLILGLLMTAQFFISSEIFITTFVVAALGVALLAITNASQVRDHAGHVCRALAWSLLICVPLIIEPTIYALSGSQNYLSSTAHGSFSFSADLLGTFVPSQLQRLAPFGLDSVGNRFVHGGENGTYLGLPILAFALYVAVKWWRLGVVRFAFCLSLIVWILSLGPRLTVNAHQTSVPLPYAILEHLPFFAGLVIDRFSLYIALLVALLVAVGLDRVGRPTRSSPHRRHHTTRATAIVVFAISAVLLIPLIPKWPYRSATVSIPAFFGSSTADRIPSGSVALTYPYPRDPTIDAMLWQASDDMRFRLIGGYAIVPTAHRIAYSSSYPLPPMVPLTLIGDYLGLSAAGVVPGTPTATPDDLRSFLRRYHVHTVIAQHIGKDPDQAYALFRRGSW